MPREHTLKTYDQITGKVILDIVGLNDNSDEVIIYFCDKTFMKLHHIQECCEAVYLADFDAISKKDLIGCRVARFEEATSEVDHDDVDTPFPVEELAIWTFYRLITDKVDLTMRWIGSSNGYYSVHVDVDFGEDKEYSPSKDQDMARHSLKTPMSFFMKDIIS